MDTAKHFESYRSSLKKSALEGFDEYAAVIPTAKPHEYPKTIDYIRHAFGNATSAAKEQRRDDYRLWVDRHRRAMLALFDRMVSDELWDYRLVDELSLLRLIEQRGWNWFKFCRIPLELTLSGLTLTTSTASTSEPRTVYLVPRYSEEFRRFWEKGLALDADEAALFLRKEGDLKTPTFTTPVLNYKNSNPGQKLLSVDTSTVCRYSGISDINTCLSVVDWSLPLF